MRPRATRAAALACAVLAACTGASDPEPGRQGGGGSSEGRPNVLIFLTDDQRERGTLEVMPKMLRWFGEGGTRFTEAYATTPLCCPYRATMFSGRYAHNHGVTRNQLSKELDQSGTVQRYLRDEGYTTAVVGKFLNNWPINDDPPNFDRWAMYKSGANERGNVYNRAEFNLDGEVRRVEEYNTDFIAERAVGLLEDFEADDRAPWLMFIAPYAPHTPFDAGPKYNGAEVPPLERSPATEEADRTDKPSFVTNEPPVETSAVERLRAKQLRTLYAVDDLVDAVMTKTEELEEDNTLAFYASDGGYLWGEHGLMKKKLAYSDSISIPLLMRWPGEVAEDEKDARIVANVDLAPTILEAAGAEPELVYPMDGRSLLTGGRRDHILSEHFPGLTTDISHWATLRSRDYQYVEHYDSEGKVAFREYYDLVEDPWQLVNVLGDDDPANDPDAGTLEELAAELTRARRCEGTDCP
ncbi:MAG: sulfatase family protein [Actinomycetota bacterium]